MSEVLRELSTMKRTVSRLVSSPRSSYLSKRPLGNRPVPAFGDGGGHHPHKQHHTSSAGSTENPFLVAPGPPQHVLPHSKLNQVVTAPSPESIASRSSRSSSSAAAAAPSAAWFNPFIRSNGDVGAGAGGGSGPASGAWPRVPAHAPPAAAPSAVVDHGDLVREMSGVRLRKTNIPKSPGGTTLLLARGQRKFAPPPNSFESSLKQRFAKAFPENEGDQPSSPPFSD
ncbi:hypothetical protein HK105_208310 [Polyrhizophydium stewartii]|uniref:Uncharacterized protein n=1 Tax=Polyrhizophydium stewartii TaxID=2732419 RepID=A0ABR4MY01_9FUNG